MKITIGTSNITTLDDALTTLIHQTEQQHGKLTTLTIPQLTNAVNDLIKHGALSQRNAVNTIAKHSQVSRVTIYNIINKHNT